MCVKTSSSSSSFGSVGFDQSSGFDAEVGFVDRSVFAVNLLSLSWMETDTHKKNHVFLLDVITSVFWIL